MFCELRLRGNDLIDDRPNGEVWQKFINDMIVDMTKGIGVTPATTYAAGTSSFTITPPKWIDPGKAYPPILP